MNVKILSVFFKLATPVALAFFLTACGTHKIGVSLPLTGEKAESGKLILQGLEMAVQEINDAGGVAGRDIELEVLDDANKPEQGKANSEAFVADQDILAVIGHYDDSVATAGLPAYDKGGLVVYSPSVGGREFVGKSKWGYTGTYPLATQMKYVSAYLKAVKEIDNVLVVKATSSFGRIATGDFLESTARDGIKTTVVEGFNDKTPGMSDDFVKSTIPGANQYQAIVILSHALNADQLIKQLRDGGFAGLIVGADRLATGLIPKLRKLGEEKGAPTHYTENILVAFPFMYSLSSLDGMRFERRYRQEFEVDPSIWAGFAYDGLHMLAGAIKTKGPDREGIRVFLEELNTYEVAISGIAGRVYFPGADRAAARQMVMARISSSGNFKPGYQQIREVRDRYNLRQVEAKVAINEMVRVAGTPYFRISVVFAGLDFDKINDVNLKAQRFDLECFLWFRWVGEVDIENIEFKNADTAAEGVKEELRKKISDDPQAENWISFKVRQSFIYPFDLSNFPFDVQDLPIVIAHKTKNADKIMIAIDREKLSDQKIKEIYPQEWEYLGRKDFAGRYRIESTFGNPSYKQGEKQADFSMYQIQISLVRILVPYINSFFVPLIVLLVIGFLVSALPLSQIDARLALVMTALLSVIVFQMAMSSNLPSVGYSMKTDVYFMVSYLFLFALVAKTLWVNAVYKEGEGDEARAKKIEKIFTLGFIPLACLAYIAITVWAFLMREAAISMAML